MIRKSSSSVVLPLALRAIGSKSTTLNHTISCPSFSINQSHYFSIVATGKDSVDATLQKLLKHEIKAIKFNLNSQVNALPDSFPYKIDERYSTYIHLKRKFLDDIETITIIVSMFDVARAIEASGDYASGGDNAEKCRRVKLDLKVPIGVIINKYCTPYHLRFEITLSAEDIIIESFHTSRVDNKDLPHEGPKIKELDSELQQCVYKYLDIRGINNSIINYLHECIDVRRNQNYLKALKHLRAFIES